MSISDVIKKFATVETLPIDVDDVVAEIRAHAKIKEIYWFPADINPEILRGFIHTWDYPNDWKYTSDPSGTHIEHVADIYYSEHDPVEWQRFVCCKEAIHLMDWEGSLVSSAEDVENLIAKIILPPELQDASTAGAAVNRDRAAELQALALLMPMAARNILLPKYKSKALTSADIARIAVIPLRYVSLVMSKRWDSVYPTLIP